MPLTFLSRFQVKPEKDAEFVELTHAMQVVADAEPDTLQYKFYRLDQSGGFAVFESFTNSQADEAHQANPEAQPIIAKMIDCMEGSYVREYLYDI